MAVPSVDPMRAGSVGQQGPMRHPNFFLVGAPRCGTTTIFRWLRAHPKVFVPSLKESHYFATDLGQFRSVRTERHYLGLFREVDDRHTAVGEASVLYLSSEVAIDNILSCYPGATLLVALRNPLELVHSWHEQLLVTLQEDEAEFERAWLKQPERRAGRHLPPHCTVPHALQYAQIGRLGEQVQRLLAKCDRQQVHFVVYDDLSRNADHTYREILRTLRVPPVGPVPLYRTNRNRQIPSVLLRKLWFRHPAFATARGRLRSLCGDRIYEGLRDVLVSRLLPVRARAPLASSMRRTLADTFREDVVRLSDLLHRDFRHWLDT